MKIKVSEATNTQLDWLVAKCEGLNVGIPAYAEKPWLQILHPDGAKSLCPKFSTDWAQGGPIMERMRIELRYHDVIVAGIWYRDGIGSDECLHRATGPTPLTAAMRCCVTSELGDEVEVPEELV